MKTLFCEHPSNHYQVVTVHIMVKYFMLLKKFLILNLKILFQELQVNLMDMILSFLVLVTLIVGMGNLLH